MTLPFDLSKPEARPSKLVFYTDTETGQWISDLASENGIEVSLLVHRICKAAREASAPTDGERRAGTEDRRQAAS